MDKDYDRIMKLKMNAREGYDVTEAELDLPLRSHLRWQKQIPVVKGKVVDLHLF